jgi:16S rRNA (cytidine1402-2'-O)-methyltransferase
MLSRNADVSNYAAVPGHLYVAATPIGNLQDCSDRLRQVLQTCNYIACESISSARVLLNHLGIQKPLISYRDSKETSTAEAILKRLHNNASIALISDAGTPTVSDPGFRVVRACRKAGIPVIPIPGPSAFLTALSASGLPTNTFLFLGFLPPKTVARQKILTAYQSSDHTLIFYESCHRIQKSIADSLIIFGPNRTACVAKELTKYYETFWVGSLEDISRKLEKASLKGEFVVIIAPESYHL